MKKLNGNDNRQLIEAAKERLRWYTMEASEEEFDVEEVDALVNLLSTLEPVEEEVQSDEETLQRFHAYVEMREAEDGGYDDESVTKSSVAKKKNIGLAVYVRTHKFIAAAAILIVIMIAGGSFGAVNASKGNGFFYWLKRDKEGMTMITSPENMDGNRNLENEVEYKNIEEVPEAYRTYIVGVGEIDQLEEYKLKGIRVTQLKEYLGIKSWWADELENKRIYIGVFIYPDKISLSSDVYLSKKVEEGLGEKQEEGKLLKETPEGDIECSIYFYKDNVRYYVEGNSEIEELTEIATEYRNLVFE